MFCFTVVDPALALLVSFTIKGKPVAEPTVDQFRFVPAHLVGQPINQE